MTPMTAVATVATVATVSVAGTRVLVTRPAEQSAELVRLLRAAGYEPVIAPTVAVEPLADLTALDSALREIGAYGWVIFSSANAAGLFVQRVAAVRAEARALSETRLVAGPAAARVLGAAGLSVDRIVSPFSAEATLRALGSEAVGGTRILLPRAEGGREELAKGLRARGATVDEVAVYRTVPVNRSDELVGALRRGVSAVTFFSPSAVRGFVAALRRGELEIACALEGAVVACLGETTAAEARAQGLRVDVVPGETTAAALVAALSAALGAAREMAWRA